MIDVNVLEAIIPLVSFDVEVREKGTEDWLPLDTRVCDDDAQEMKRRIEKNCPNVEAQVVSWSKTH